MRCRESFAARCDIRAGGGQGEGRRRAGQKRGEGQDRGPGDRRRGGEGQEEGM